MIDWLLDLRIDRRSFLVPMDVLIVLLVAVLWVRPRTTGRWATAVVPVAVGALAGALGGALVIDVFDVFGMPLTLVTRMWICIAGAVVALAIVRLVKTRWWRRAIAIVAIPAVLIGAAAAINVDYGGFRDLRDVLGISPYPELTGAIAADQAAHQPATGPWSPPAGMPGRGVVRRVDIPADTSHFAARSAVVYLPPAALVAHPAPLPVIVMFSGQPGSPADMFTLGRTHEVLDTYAARHQGRAPIVVAPDQLGAPDRNDMCTDSPDGRIATYVTVDVTRWIARHLTVLPGAAHRAVAGFSQGATCAMQFGTAHPELYGAILSVSGELKPISGPATMQRVFGGSRAAYEAVQPLHTMAHRRYPDSFAVFAVGGGDTTFGPGQRTTAAAAERAGMTTRFITAPRSSHDWNTVRYALAHGLPLIADRMGAGG